MKKYYVDDIKIKSPGQLIKDAIVEVYGNEKLEGTEKIYQAVTEFASNIGYSPDNLYNNLNQIKTIKLSDEFKTALINDLDRDYRDIVKSERQQTKEYVENIINYKELYNDESDYEVLERVKSLCIKYRLMEETASICSLIAKHYQKFNKIDNAIQNMRLAIDFSDRIVDEMSISYTMDLGLLYYYKGDNDKAHKYYNYAHDLIKELETMENKKVKNTIKSLNYYRLGLIYYDMNELQNAQYYFNRALEWAEPKDRGDIYLNLGNISTRKGNYPAAMKLFDKAFNNYEKDDIINQATVLNNKAELYKEDGQIDKAERYIKQAFEMIKGLSEGKEITFSLTYIEIMVIKEDYTVLDKLFDYLQNIDNIYIFKPIFIAGIKGIINSLGRYEQIAGLNLLNRNLFSIIKNKVGEDEFLKSLKALICDILLTLDRIEGRRKDS